MAERNAYGFLKGHSVVGFPENVNRVERDIIGYRGRKALTKSPSKSSFLFVILYSIGAYLH